MASEITLRWQDASARQADTHLYAGRLYVARIKAMRPGQWTYELCSPAPSTLKFYGDYATAEAARSACESAVRQSLYY